MAAQKNGKYLLLTILVLSTVTIYLNYLSDTQALRNDSELRCGFTQHFLDYLAQNDYARYQFNRKDIRCGEYGGKVDQSDTIKKVPVIFIHGNSDVGFSRGQIDGYASWQTGFRSLATYLTSMGYKQSQLYTLTWGPGDLQKSSLQYHSKQYLTRLRAFVEAVLDYTKADKINVVSHSMGVTLSRKVIKGGIAKDHKDGLYDLGPSLHSKVKTFVGIAGGNLGLIACFTTEILPCCSIQDGFFPGATALSNPAEFLHDLNIHGGSEGDNVYSIWSKYDDVIGGECVVWGKVTCRIGDQTGEIVKKSLEWSHMALRDKTGPDMLGWL